jgi:inner membrane protein
MASLFGHAAAAAALGQAAPAKYRADWRFWYSAVLCAILPDADVIAFQLGIPYEHVLGHRGRGAAAAARFRPDWRKDGWRLAALLSAIAASHGLLDGLTNGGRGVAFFAPFENSRYFLPWTPIQVSPIGVKNFLTERGLRVIASELGWVFLPSLLVGALLRWKNRRDTIGS